MPDPSFERRVLEAFGEALEWPAADRDAELARRYEPDLAAAAGRRREACSSYRAAIRAWQDLRSCVALNDFDGGPELKEVEAKAKAACV